MVETNKDAIAALYDNICYILQYHPSFSRREDTLLPPREGEPQHIPMPTIQKTFFAEESTVGEIANSQLHVQTWLLQQ